MRTKTITISIRLKPDELSIIEEKAKESASSNPQDALSAILGHK